MYNQYTRSFRVNRVCQLLILISIALDCLFHCVSSSGPAHTHVMAQHFNRTMSLRTWPSMYGDYEFHDDDDDDDDEGKHSKANYEQVNR